MCKFQEIPNLWGHHILVLISWLHQMRHCDKWMIESFRGWDSPVSIHTQQQLQEVHKPMAILFFSYAFECMDLDFWGAKNQISWINDKTINTNHKMSKPKNTYTNQIIQRFKHGILDIVVFSSVFTVLLWRLNEPKQEYICMGFMEPSVEYAAFYHLTVQWNKIRHWR